MLLEKIVKDQIVSAGTQAAKKFLTINDEYKARVAANPDFYNTVASWYK